MAGTARGPGTPCASARGAATTGGTPVDDLASLDSLLALPAVHLVVDGYNVSKTGYPDLPLADQRTRLVTQLAALGPGPGSRSPSCSTEPPSSPRRSTARAVCACCSASRTCSPTTSSATSSPRSRAGRPLLVATSDQEVVRSVRRRGAHTVPSVVLLQRLRAA